MEESIRPPLPLRPWRRGGLAVAEAAGVLLACWLVILAGTALMMAIHTLTGGARFTAEIPLGPVAGEALRSLPRTAAEIERGLGGATVMVRGEGERVSVRIDGLSVDRLPDPDPRVALIGAGYDPGEPTFRRDVDPQRLIEAMLFPALLVQAGVLLLAGVLMMRWRIRSANAEARVGALAAAGIGIFGGGVAFGLAVGLGALQSALGFPLQEQEWVVQLLGDRRRLLALAPLLVLIVPLSEEVFFRGYMLRFVTGRSGIVLGLIVSSALFSALHLNWTGVLIYFSVGALFGLLCLATRQLAAAVTAHMVYNGLVLLTAIVAPGA